MIQFDKHGYLFPHEIIEVSLADFEQYFVADLPDKERRKEIFQTYLQYLSELKKIVGKEFFQLVNGSFTTKKELPGDIDFVTFVDYQIYRRSFEAIDNLNLKWENSEEIDCMILPFSYPGHPHFIQCLSLIHI